MASGSRADAIGLVLHPTTPVQQSVEIILASASADGVRVLGREIDRHRIPESVDVVTDREFVAQVRAVIALGGDGTMLGAMRLVIDRPVPVLGVNHGSLGFLVEVSPAQLTSALARVAARDFTIEQHACLVADADRAVLATRFAFNDVVLARLSRAGAVSVDLTVNDLHFGYYRSDAVVISTPTGSTAYNYAAGGPVLSPSSAAVVVTPVAPMSGVSRPVVLGAEDTISLAVAPDSAPVAVEVDGTPGGELGDGDALTATTRQEAAQVVRLSAGEHASRSRVKLSLLDLPLRPDQLLELIPPELRRHAETGVDGLPTSS
jgi:NAD+ kinase